MLLGIDIGGTRIKAGLVDTTGSLMSHASAPTPHNLAECRAAIAALLSEVTGGAPVEAAGVGCKGVIDPDSGVVLRLPGSWGFLNGTNLAELLGGLGEVPIAAGNDAIAALAGEMLWGEARGRADVLLLTIGTGVGGAILSGGRILRGFAGVAGHIGHLTVQTGGPLCICGNRGCLETLFSARAIEGEAFRSSHQGIDSPMCNELRAYPGRLSSELVYHHAASGDAAARLIITSRTAVLAGALAGLMHTLDPELVLITGAVAGAGPALFEPLRREVDLRTRGILGRTVPILPGGVADNSGVVGAAALGLLKLRQTGG